MTPHVVCSFITHLPVDFRAGGRRELFRQPYTVTGGGHDTCSMSIKKQQKINKQTKQQQQTPTTTTTVDFRAG